MSRQQSRSPGDGAIDPSLAQKKRARHRLVGAICLCLLAAVVVPLVLESEPRPSRDLPLEIAAAPGAAAAQASEQPQQPQQGQSSPPRGDAGGPTASGTIAPGGSLSAVTTVTSPAASEAAQPPVALAPPATAAAPTASGAASSSAAKADASREAAKPAPAPTTAPTPAPTPARPAKKDEGPDVIARLIERADSKSGTAAAPAAQRKFLVQIGAYSNVQSARNMSDRAVQAGLRPYQETVKTAQGDWIRVRVGPFPTRQDAERAQQDLKRAGVTAAIIAL